MIKIDDYKLIRKEIGTIRFDSINDYIKYVEKCRNKSLEMKDVLFNQRENEKFNMWFEKRFKPFNILEHDNGDVSVFLFEQDFCYDFFHEVKNDEPYYGNGYTYEDVFKDYLSDNYPNLSKKLEYDTEMGMFCVYCEDMKTADEVALILNDLYKDENKMIDLIKVAKEKYDYEFDIKI